MKQEPVAWMSPDGKVSQTEGKLFYIPLYTAPQTKPLKEIEIVNMFYNPRYRYDEDGHLNFIAFARAIEERHGIK